MPRRCSRRSSTCSRTRTSRARPPRSVSCPSAARVDSCDRGLRTRHGHDETVMSHAWCPSIPPSARARAWGLGARARDRRGPRRPHRPQ
jgi:hypothetical protein